MNEKTNNGLLISIITVVYNGEKHLEQTILSILNQSYKNIEYIIIDGGSNDSTIDIIKKYNKQITYWISEKDNGIYDAMNKGILQAKGDVIGFVNADDFIYDYTLSLVNQTLGKTVHKHFTFGSIHLMNDNGRIYAESNPSPSEMIKINMYNEVPFSFPSMFFKKEVFKKIGLFSLNFKSSSDYDFILRLLENGIDGIKLDRHTGVFRDGGISGGFLTAKENFKILNFRKIPKSLIYKRFVITLLKLFMIKYLPSFVVNILRKLRNNNRFKKIVQ